MKTPHPAEVVTTIPHQPKRAVRPSEVSKRTGLSIPTIWRLRRRGDFPQPFRLSRGAIAWLEADIDNWIASRAAARENA